MVASDLRTMTTGNFALTKTLGEVLQEIENNKIGKFERGLMEVERTLRWQILSGVLPLFKLLYKAGGSVLLS